MDKLSQDLRYAVRMLLKSPGFSLIVVITLGLGIGANTAIFTLMDQVLLRRLPVHNPEELVLLDGDGLSQGAFFADNAFSYPMYRDLRDKNEVFSGVLARFPVSLSLTHKGTTERVHGELVSGNYLEVLGVRPLLGRGLTTEDDRTPGAHPVVMLSHGYWTRRFGSDPKVLDQTVSVNGHPLTVVGVTPPGFNGIEVGAAPDLFVPLMMKAQMTPTWDELENRRFYWLHVMARLKPGVSVDQAESGVNVPWRQSLEAEVVNIPIQSPRFVKGFVEKRLKLRAGLRGRSDLRGPFSTPLIVLMGMVGLVLLIACANVANLLVARAASRQKEMAIRLAVGASRGQIVRQLLAESLLLALAGGAFGLLLACWTGALLVRALPFEEAARSLRAEPDLRVALFAFGISLLTGVLFGMVPAFQSTRPVLTATLKEEGASVTGGPGHVRFRKGLVVAQVALSLLLLVGAGLFARSLYNLKNLHPGFEAERLMTLSIDPSLNGYDQPRIRALFQQLQDEFAALPGVRSASTAEEPLMTDNLNFRTVKVEGYNAKEGEDTNPNVNNVGPRYFETLGMSLLAGREFTEEDTLGAPRVAIVNETFARYFFGTASPLGHRFGFGPDKTDAIEIVGLVKDGKVNNLREKTPRFAYTPYRQDPVLNRITFYVRTMAPPEGMAASLRQIVQRTDPALPLFDVKTLAATVSESLFIDRMIAALSAAFGFLATLLAALGLYGVMSYTVVRRTREIGIRIALGAEKGNVLWLVLKEVAVMAAIGVGIGLPSAWAAGRVIESQLFGLSAADPLTLGLSTATLLAVAFFSGYVPAARATRVDPMVALRYQ
jgi:predicted permease